jgi:hypothetical protein
VAFGPYLSVAPGDYFARIHFRVVRRRSALASLLSMIKVDVVSNVGKRTLAKRGYRFVALTRESHTIPFTVVDKHQGTKLSQIEVRLWTDGTLPVTLSSVVIGRMLPSRRRPFNPI